LRRFRKQSPARLPAGYIMIAGAVGIVTIGLVRYFRDVEEKK
jgi:hypothetical protein